MLRFRRIVDYLKDYLPFLLKLHILIRLEIEGFLKTSSYFAGFSSGWAMSIFLLDFGVLSVRNFPCTILANLGDSYAPQLSMIVVRECCSTHLEEAWQCCSLLPISGHWTQYLHIHGTGWSLQGIPVSFVQPVHSHPSEVVSQAQTPNVGCL